MNYCVTRKINISMDRGINFPLTKFKNRYSRWFTNYRI